MSAKLNRELGLGGALVTGLGSILGTGVFVSVAMGVDIASANVFYALGIAGCLAILNGLSSAQLAAAHPVSGGTYEYGHQFISPLAGFCAGWLFLCAKSASAAAAALGIGTYLFTLLPQPVSAGSPAETVRVLALLVVFGITAVSYTHLTLPTILLV